MIEKLPITEKRPWKEVFSEYKEQFKKMFPIAFKIMEIGGIHPDKQKAIPNPYLNNESDEEDYSNIGEHCIAVAICAKKIADALKEKKLIDQATSDYIIIHSLIHDVNKVFEIFRKKAKETGQPIEVHDRAAYESVYDILCEKYPYHPLFEYLKFAGEETGHNSLPEFVELNENNEPILKKNLTFEEKIVHLADDLTASPSQEKTINDETKFVTFAERMDLGNFSQKYPFLFKEGFGFHECGKPIIIKNCQDKSVAKGVKCVKTYAEWQTFVAKRICDELKPMINPESQQDSEIFIKDLINRES